MGKPAPNELEIREILESGAPALGLDLSRDHTDTFVRYFKLLLLWNRTFNLTRITNPKSVAISHFLDSLAVAPMIPNEVKTLLDLGSGAGFPGIPIKIVRPELTITLLEKSRKKVSFLKTAIRELGLEGIIAVHARAEDLAGGEGFDLVVSRAVAGIPGLIHLGGPLLGPKGILAAMKGEDLETNLDQLPGFTPQIRNYRLPGIKEIRHVVFLTAKA